MASSLILKGVLLLVLCVFPPMGTSGFKLKLIPRDAVESPMYLGNLTREQRLGQLLSLSIERAHQLAASIKLMTNMTRTREIGISPSFIRPVLSAALSSYYVVQVSIGSPPAPFNLALDTGSDFPWVQCAGCVTCFTIKGGSFDFHYSNTFKWLPCDHPLCGPPICDMGACLYAIYYLEPARTMGVRATDTFTFLSDNGALESINNIVFGCAVNTYDLNFGENAGDENVIAGVFGMGGGPSSFLSQLGERSGRAGRFSYCLPRMMERGISTYLHFGQDANIRPGTEELKLTPLVRGHTRTHYYLNLMDISVATTPLKFSPGTFDFKDDGTGGFMIDTGAPASLLIRDAYTTLHGAVALFFLPFELQPFDGTELGLNFCKVRPTGFNEFPTITLHLYGADLVLEPESAFFITERYFCLMFRPNNFLSILGAFQQTNYRFVYDTPTSTLLFAPEKCNDAW